MSDNSAAERDGDTPGGNGIDGERVDGDGATEDGATENRATENRATEDGAAANRLTEDGTDDESVRFADVPARFALTDPRPSRTRPRFGRLEELGFLLATCRGQLPPRPPRHVRVVVLAADHGIAARGVSARGPGDTARLFDSLLAGGTPLGVLVDEAGAGLRAVDLAIEQGSGPYHVRDGSGAIDVEDALTAAETTAALRAGAELADAEVDAGADLLIPADLAVGGTTPAATVVAALTGTEPVAVVGRGSGIDDATWMRKTAAVRDALRRARPVVRDPVALIRTAGGADLAATAGFLAQAAVRRTPVLLDGLPVCAAALLAEELAPGAREWWFAAHRSPEPAHTLALEHLDLDPIVDLGIAETGGYGALTALPLLSTAAHLGAQGSP